MTADAVTIGREVLRREAEAVSQLIEKLDGPFSKAVAAIRECRGNVVVTGIGKPYIIGQKISASMASTGTPSFTIHPVDALHGDLGRVRDGDVLIVLSNSGSSPEIVDFVAAASRLSIVKIAITKSADNPLGKACDLVLELGHIDEADHIGAAPSSSSTAMLALGDALTLTVAKLNQFSEESFAKYHPGGALGRRYKTVGEVMRSGEQVATVSPSCTVRQAIAAITRSRCGAACETEDGKLRGIFTDGDLRRVLEKDPEALLKPVETVMTEDPHTVSASMWATDALRLLRERQIDELPVVDEVGSLLGLVDVQDLM